MATLREDLISIANYLDTTPADLRALPAAMPEALGKIDWKRLICFAIPIYNLIAPMGNLPPIPVPPFCTTPADPLA